MEVRRKDKEGEREGGHEREGRGQSPLLGWGILDWLIRDGVAFLSLMG